MLNVLEPAPEVLFPREPVALDRLETFAFGLDHAEGIAVTPDGAIFVGGEAGQIYRIDDDVPVEIANTGGFLLGLAADGAGRIYAIDNTAKCVWRLAPSAGTLEIYSNGPAEASFKVPNWGAFAPNGDYFITDSGDWLANNGLIYVVRPGGQTVAWSTESTAFPNGCCVSSDGDAVYVAESVPGAIVKIPINDDGTAGTRQVLCHLGTAVPDGVACTDDGALVIACYRPDIIYRWHPVEGLSVLAFDPRGTALAAPTNVAFVGDDLGTLVVPNLGRWNLTRGRLGVRGAPLHYPTPAQLEPDHAS